MGYLTPKVLAADISWPRKLAFKYSFFTFSETYTNAAELLYDDSAS